MAFTRLKDHFAWKVIFRLQVQLRTRIGIKEIMGISHEIPIISGFYFYLYSHKSTSLELKSKRLRMDVIANH